MPLAPTRSTAMPAPNFREELRKRAVARLQDKCDPARSRHKPISLVRQEARRLAEHFLDAEASTLTKSEREQLLDDILADLPGLGPLDELFRDDTLSEFLVLAHNQIIRRNGDTWLPTSVQFRDAEHYRRTLLRSLEAGEAIGDAAKVGDGAHDVKLPNGFRLIAVLPPAVLEQPPLATFRRLATAPVSATAATPAPRTAQSNSSGSIPLGERSGTVAFGTRTVPTGQSTQRMLDPWDRAKLRITERFVQRLAANGVYDISTVASADLRRVMTAIVLEANDTEKLHLDHLAQERMTLEILAHMQRTP